MAVSATSAGFLTDFPLELVLWRKIKVPVEIFRLMQLLLFDKAFDFRVKADNSLRLLKVLEISLRSRSKITVVS